MSRAKIGIVSVGERVADWTVEGVSEEAGRLEVTLRCACGVRKTVPAGRVRESERCSRCSGDSGYARLIAAGHARQSVEAGRRRELREREEVRELRVASFVPPAWSRLPELLPKSPPGRGAAGRRA